jgi:hypothetical protein
MWPCTLPQREFEQKPAKAAQEFVEMAPANSLRFRLPGTYLGAMPHIRRPAHNCLRVAADNFTSFCSGIEKQHDCHRAFPGYGVRDHDIRGMSVRSVPPRHSKADGSRAHADDGSAD